MRGSRNGQQPRDRRLDPEYQFAVLKELNPWESGHVPWKTLRQSQGSKQTAEQGARDPGEQEEMGNESKQEEGRGGGCKSTWPRTEGGCQSGTRRLQCPPRLELATFYASIQGLPPDPLRLRFAEVPLRVSTGLLIPFHAEQNSAPTRAAGRTPKSILLSFSGTLLTPSAA